MKPPPTRRTFLTQSSAITSSLLLGNSLVGRSTNPHALASGNGQGRAAGNEELRVALIGCGGRGAGAAHQALSTKGNVRLVAMADAFSDRLEGTLNWLAENHVEQVDVPEERRFVGFDAYQKAIDCGVDVVVLATPPGFRPIHFEYAIQQDKHVFMEKPVAVDGPGVRRVLAAAAIAKTKALKVGVGLQRHHQAPYLELIRRIRAGEIGKINLLRCYWNSAGVWVRERQPDWNEMTYQMRNWYYFNWLCGDHITEQHIHNLDVCNWVMNDFPAKAHGQGGRQVRTGLDHGEIFDHHMIEFTYPDGTKMFSQCRHIPDTRSEVNEHAHGSLGTVNFGRSSIEFSNGERWRFVDEYKDPYQVEHDELFAAIRSGAAFNEADYGAKSTLTSILGRMASYSGKEVSWEQALNSELDLSPTAYAWDAEPSSLPDENGRYLVPVPGVTVAF
ncbi:MAG TPA: Gfo/Idh/MocA family oxidoreductase [Planctomycetota bacterium]|nr:dehydrogenase [Planctomycetota bacterium]MDP7246869.1 Gfo/Idh/MocA family oxidoreductase [Planctomycetota bacterium]HJM39769.1 Gfo/Idh/MocA family oxidoreductase [Planctomycetota bacterium]